MAAAPIALPAISHVKGGQGMSCEVALVYHIGTALSRIGITKLKHPEATDKEMAAHWLERSRAYAPLATRSAIVTLQLLTAMHLVTTDLLEIRLCSGYSMLPTLSHEGDFVLISPLHVRFHQTSSQRAAAGIPSPSSSSSSSSASALSNFTPDFQITRGDLVISTSPTDPHRTVCKRVIGLEGDMIELDPSRTSRALAKGREESETVEKRWEEVDAEHRSMLAQQRRERAERSTGEIVQDDLVESFNAARRRKGLKREDPDGSEHVRIPRGYVWLAGDNMSNSTDSRGYGPVPLGLLKGKVLARVWPNPTWFTNPMRTVPDTQDT